MRRKLAGLHALGVSVLIWSCGTEDPAPAESTGIGGSGVAGATGATCGNGMVDPGETCDPPASCPASCDDGNVCTVDQPTGSAQSCNVACSNTAITACSSGDGCCPGGCTSTTDADCPGATGGSGGAAGGTAGTGGTSTGGTSTGGTSTGGTGTGGTGTGGTSTGGTSTGGSSGTGGDAGTGGGSVVDCSATMPTGGTDHCGANTSGTSGGLNWSLWSNAINGNSCITTYDTTAFGARWSESGDFLARLGLEWGSNGEPYDQYGTIEAQFSYNKTGSGGGFSYIGVYGWTNNPCVEYYIVDDSYNTFPFDAWNATHTETAFIDGEDYKLFRNSTTGTGGSRCSGVSSWDQFWSIRQSARQCGTISVTQHFDAWKAAGMTMGTLLEVKILVEVGGGTGSIEFPVANVTAE